MGFRDTSNRAQKGKKKWTLYGTNLSNLPDRFYHNIRLCGLKQTPTSWSFSVMSGLSLDHSTSSSPVSSGPEMKVHPRLTFSPTAFWMVSGPGGDTCRASATSNQSKKELTSDLPQSDFHSVLPRGHTYNGLKGLSTAYIFFQHNGFWAVGFCSATVSKCSRRDLRLIGLLSQTKEDLGVGIEK